MIVHRIPLIENVKIDQNLGIIQSTHYRTCLKKILLMAVGTMLLRGGESNLTLTVK